ncbi:membrane fusogenic activity family protein [Streptomonospora nanhaiensis]|uniref:Membrane fusogenic activity family protein n=1 Tax=Streptomonospora nanhaiensis TaxID=1323731 RepID=A0A853BUA2_9ACTN|nr:membrane fusogenic activity family protein [Streptomonospora nanhaiensis]MBV2365693.1 membrane fusogenic activity family protein [Streptomonospora nanhaiensis]MBX9390673.1 membrane fusogenic activity family protein [Streptomonospora nanhaiensis]NYI98868.1 hypothetical protein [Streptomonospora nanhaiensis]
MVVDAVRAYLEAVNGLTELTRKRAVAAAKVLLRAGEDRPAAPAPRLTAVGGGPATAAPAGEGEPAANGFARSGATIQSLAAELIETSQANREALNSLIAAEVERVLERRELVSRAEYDRLGRRVAELERRLAAQRAQPRVVAPLAEAAAPTGAPAAEPSAQEGAGDLSASAPGRPEARPAADEVADPAGGERPSAPRDPGPERQAAVGQLVLGEGEHAPAAPEAAPAARERSGEADGAVDGAVDEAPAPDSGAGAASAEPAPDAAAPAKGSGKQQRSAKARTSSSRSGAAAKSGSAKNTTAKRSGGRGRNSTSGKKND